MKTAPPASADALPRLAWVDHSYHRKTASSRFLLDLLAQAFRVTTLWDDSWQPGAPTLTARAVNDLGAETVVFFQNLPPRRTLRAIKARQYLYVPMYDSVFARDDVHWRRLRAAGLKVVSFSQTVHRQLVRAGLTSLPVQYWPAPAVAAPRPGVAGQAPSVFFWMRHTDIGWPTLRALLGPAFPGRIYLRVAADPGQAPAQPDAADRRRYDIKIIDGWLERERYLELLGQCQLFMAPRLREGIGMAFLEAMAMGLAVVAPDLPTMNEYLKNGDNGYLYTPEAPARLDLTDLAAVRQRALASVRTGHRAWQAQQADILAFCAQSPPRPDWRWRLRGALGL